MTNFNLKKELQVIAETSDNSIEKAVALEALEQEDIRSFFFDLAQYGCISGMVLSLIYYVDTHSFFDTHYYQIEELRSEYEESTGMPLAIQGDLKNFLAWFAFEYVAQNIADKLTLDV